MTLLIGSLRRLAVLAAINESSDAQLLSRFVEQHDHAAFAALVERHGPMVYGVCRRALSAADAEDAFQATFLVLVRKAAAVRPREMLANWLYGVACFTARKARALVRKRRARERQVELLPERPEPPPNPWSELPALLDGELRYLPDKYRAPVVLCDLEGLSRKAAAKQLGWAEGSLSWRLATGRKMLAQRLTRRGIGLAGAAGGFSLSPAAAMSLPVGLADEVMANGCSFLADPTSTVLSPQIALLMKGAVQDMVFSKISSALILVCLLSLTLFAGWFWQAPPVDAQLGVPVTAVSTSDESRFFQGGQRSLRGFQFDDVRGAATLLLTAEGDRIVLRFKQDDTEYEAVAKRLFYDEAKQLLMLEAGQDGEVRVVRRKVKEPVQEIQIRCQKLIMDRINKTMQCSGTGSIRQ